MRRDGCKGLPLPSARKKVRNRDIIVEIASGISKEDACKKYDLSLTQLNRILREANDEAEEWYKSLPRQTMIQIFRHNCEKIFSELKHLEKIRDSIARKDIKLEFDMTRSIIAMYAQYNKMVAEGPSLTRQKEVTDAAEKAVKAR